MEKQIGYEKPLYIMAFDHRASFVKKMFGWEGNLSEDQIAKVQEAKHIIYEGLVRAIEEKGANKEFAAVLCDEQFGSKVHEDAAKYGLVRILTVEKSGQDEFDFEYGQGFGEHILKFKPDFAKALIRYNPEGDRGMNVRQAERLKMLSEFCHANGIKFLIEPLVPATPDELDAVGGDQQLYDSEVRPGLVADMIGELQNAGVEADIWKIEGLSSSKDYEAVVAQAKSGGRENVSVVVLGRGESPEKVEQWLEAGRQVPGVTGFAIGRTIFWEPLSAYRDGAIDRHTAVNQICDNYMRFYQIFTN